MDQEACSELRKKRRGTRIAVQIVGDLKSDLSPPDVNPVVTTSDGDPVGPDDSKQGALFHQSAAAARLLGKALGNDLGVASRRAGHRLRTDFQRLRRHAERLAAQVRETDYSRLGSDLTVAAGGLSGWVSRLRGRSGADAGDDARTRPAPQSGSPGRRKTWLTATAAVLVSGILVAALTAWWALRDVPWQEIAEGSLKPVVVLESADGKPLVQQGPFQGAYATRGQFPQHLVDAVLSVEDRRFHEHFGIDLRGMARALFRNLVAGQVVEGGSTITQQLIKILYLESDRTYKRKIQEFVIALWLENKFGKDEILTRYLNNIYLGAGATGIPAAARVYFDKDPSELDLRESAMLAGLIRAPSQLSPLTNPEGARARVPVVLDAMVANGKLGLSEAAAAKTEFAALKPTRPAERAGSWFADWVMEEARAIAGPYRGTIRVRTTMMPRLQAIAQDVVAKAMDAEGETLGASQAALVAMTPEGAVVAMVGGRKYGDSEFNRAATAKRQPGSTFKLFVLHAALKAGKTPRDRVMDEKMDIDGWSPENFGGEYNGRVTIAEAFARSLNAATVALAQEVGIDEVADSARELGINAKLTETPALALGASEVTLIDLTGAYASVRAGVAPVEPWGIVSFQSDQQRPFRVGPSKQPETSLKAMQNDLVGLLNLVVERGTGREARLDGFAAGKTGTSQNHRDAWFVGFTEPLVAGVWVGNDDGSPMRDVTGGKLPAVIWRNFMTAAIAELSATPPTSEQGAAPATASVEDESVACNVRACSRSYRSFRPSDCTYQPYRGARKLCEK
jgi:1A family penicillin-binding protein